MGHATTPNEKPVVVTKSAMFFALIIIVLIVATANFIQVMGNADHGHGAHGGAHDAHKTETHGAHDNHGDAHKTEEPAKAAH